MLTVCSWEADRELLIDRSPVREHVSRSFVFILFGHVREKKSINKTRECQQGSSITFLLAVDKIKSELKIVKVKDFPPLPSYIIFGS